MLPKTQHIINQSSTNWQSATLSLSSSESVEINHANLFPAWLVCYSFAPCSALLPELTHSDDCLVRRGRSTCCCPTATSWEFTMLRTSCVPDQGTQVLIKPTGDRIMSRTGSQQYLNSHVTQNRYITFTSPLSGNFSLY